MSVMGPMYDIPSNIRYGIFILEYWDDKECIESGLNEVREAFKNAASELSIEQVKENLEYIESLQAYLNELVELYAKLGSYLPKDIIKDYFELGVDLGYDVSEEEEHKEEQEEEQDKTKVEYTPEQKFCRHALADHKNALLLQVKLATLALKIVEIAKEEISKYVPENPSISSEEKVLKPIVKTE